MPFVSIYFPPRLLATQPHFSRNLITNKNRLTTNFDLYRTLLDVLQISAEAVNKGSLLLPNNSVDGDGNEMRRPGTSLIANEIPVGRTCTAALIPQQFCVCMEEAPVRASERVESSARTLIESYFHTTAANTACLTLVRVEPIDWGQSVRSYVLPPASRLGARSPKHWSELRNSTSNAGRSYAEMADLDDIVEIEITGRVEVLWRGTGGNTTSVDQGGGTKCALIVHYRARLSHYRQIGQGGNRVGIKVRPLLTGVNRRGENGTLIGGVLPKVLDDFCSFPFQSMIEQ